MKTFQPKLFSALKNYSAAKFTGDLTAGIIVAIIALPLSIALAIASGASPAQGLYTAIVAGFVIAFLGGSNVNISGPTAAFASIVAGIISANGFSGLVVATVMAGLILIIMGICRMGTLIKYIPHTITVGFTAGIAVTILIGQIKDFLQLDFGGAKPIEASEKVVEIVKNISTFNIQAIIVGVIALAILIIWPMIGRHTKGVVSMIFTKIPPSIIAVIIGIIIVSVTPLTSATIGSLYPDLSTALPKFALPEFDAGVIVKVIPDAVTIAILAAIESLLSCVVSDGMIGDKHNPNTELIAQGAGNICSGLFGGIPATGAIARTAANVKNGGRSPVAGMIHAVVLLLFLVLLMPLAKLIPMPVIAAILFIVAYNMSEWRSFLKICKTKKVTDIIVLVITFALTVIFNLVIAIVVGLIVHVIFSLAARFKNKSKAAA